MILAIYGIILLCLVANEIQQENLVQAFNNAKSKASKSKAKSFYSSSAWRKARHECFKLQMERTGLTFIECEVCGSTSMDLDDAGKRIVMSVGHDKARSTHPHLALDQNNLFPQCMPCNLGQGIEQRLAIQ